MKKIVLFLIVTLSLISCTSSSENETTNLIPKELLGTWKLIGYYDDIGDDPVTGSNYHLVENGDVYKFNSDSSFDNVGDEINPDGTFSVSADNVLTRNFNSNSLNPNMVFNDKIFILTSEILEYGCNQDNILCNTYRYQKIVTTSP